MIPRFRAWHKKDRRMIDQGYWYISFTGYVYKSDGEDNKGRELLWLQGFGEEDDSVILMQSTGLQDKNGREIFEGDIINFDYYGRLLIGRVEFEKGCFWWVGRDSSELVYKSHEGIEVIGNVYQNPEILEASEP